MCDRRPSGCARAGSSCTSATARRRPRPRPAGEPDALADVGRLAADDVRRRQRAAELPEAGQHRDRCHAVRVELALAEVVLADLEHRQVTRARRRRGSGVDDDQRVVAVEQVVGEVHRRGCRSRRPGRRRAAAAAASRRATSLPKPSSPRKRLPMPATRTGHRRVIARPPGRQRLDLVGCEVVVPAGACRRGRGRVVLEHDGEVRAAVDVEVAPRARRRSARRGTCPARRRAGTAAAAPGCPCATGDAADEHRSVSGCARRVLARVPPRHRRRRHRDVALGRRVDGGPTAPCSRASASSGIASQPVEDRGRARVGAAGLGLLLRRSWSSPAA